MTQPIDRAFEKPIGKLRISDTSMWLIGSITDPEIRGRKLPSNRQVLQCFFHQRKMLEKAVSESWKCVFEKIVLFWKAADVRIQNRQSVIERIEKLVDEYKKLKRSRCRSPVQEVREYEFKEKLDDLFDIAHVSALDFFTKEEDRLFLMAQREKGRRGYLGLFIESSTDGEKSVKRKKEESDEDEIVIVDDW